MGCATSARGGSTSDTSVSLTPGAELQPNDVADILERMKALEEENMRLTAQLHACQIATASSASNRPPPPTTLMHAPTVDNLYEQSYTKSDDALLTGLCVTGSAEERASFLREWVTFIKELRIESLRVQTRTLSDFSPAERLPSQKTVLEWTDKCLELTERWYGRDLGNVSALYEFLMEASSGAGMAAYDYDEVPTQRSADNFTLMIDGNTRRELYSSASKEEEPKKKKKKEEEEEAGDGDGDGDGDDDVDSVDDSGPVTEHGYLEQTAGESAIDNTVLPNVLTPLQSRVLLAGGRIKTMLLRKAAARQKALLEKLSKEHREDLLTASASRIRTVMADLEANAELARLKVEPTSFSFRMLRDRGTIISSWGQLDEDSQVQVQKYLTRELGKQYRKEKALKRLKSRSSKSNGSDGSDGSRGSDHGSSQDTLAPPPRGTSGGGGGGDSDLDVSRGPLSESNLNLDLDSRSGGGGSRAASPDAETAAAAEAESQANVENVKRLVGKFIDWTRNNPGRIYKNDKKLHKKLLFLGMWTQELVVVKRSVIESVTHQRYIPVPWTRQLPLVRVVDGKEEVVREPGDREHSRLRKNYFPYCESHGLSIASGGIEEGAENHGTLAYEFGHMLPKDADAKVGNWFTNDVEKICREARFLNPAGGTDNILPAEEYHDVAQNPQAGSSIGATQHTQISRSIVEDWPVLMRQQKPMWVDELRAYMDLVQIGKEFDSFFLKFRTQRPDYLPFMEFIHSTRLQLVRDFEGRNIDFFIGAYPEGNKSPSWFTIIFAPICALQLVPDPFVERPFLITFSPDTKEYWSDDRLAVGVLDTMSSKGGFMVFTAKSQERAMEGRAAVERVYDFTRKVGARKALRRILLQSHGYIDHMAAPPITLAKSSTYSSLREPVFMPLLDSTGNREMAAAKLDLDEHHDDDRRLGAMEEEDDDEGDDEDDEDVDENNVHEQR